MQLIVDTVKLWNSFSKMTLCISVLFVLLLNNGTSQAIKQQPKTTSQTRQRININEGWWFGRYTSQADNLIYDERPQVADRNDNVVADSKPTEAVIIGTSEKVLKKWILPTANDFINDSSKHYQRPAGNPGAEFSFVQNNFNDKDWEKIDLPHDWAINGPFYREANAIVGGAMGRLPLHGVAWWPVLLDLTDRMGFLVIDEIFDSWERRKTPLDFHLIFPDWYEADTRSFIRRDRNHPSVVAWSFGNEVGEQHAADAGALLAKKIMDIVHEGDNTRPAAASMNYAKPDMPFPQVMDIISLNYQGERIRDAPAYDHLSGIKTSPLYPAFQKKFPDKLIVSSETASALSTRGTYIFPVYNDISAPVSDSTGGDSKNKYVSAYELYTAQFGASPDKVFASQDKHPFVAGEFAWSGWDYLGEPTPYYSARSSYCGIIDLAGFKKDRFYLYQSRWKPNLPMAHILPHWNWPDRIGLITPVHVFTSGDEAELFLNGRSLGKKKKEASEYRLRWDDVRYQAGELKVVSYKNGKHWAAQSIKTTDISSQLLLAADRKMINADGEDLSFITVKIADKNGLMVPDAKNKVSFTIDGPGKIVATDNGDPADLISFASKEREAYFGLILVIVRSKKGKPGTIKVNASSPGLKTTTVEIKTK